MPRTKKPRPYTVILTGGIASGKSTVSKLFEDHGVPIVDTDVIARELVTPGEPALEQIIEKFGKEYIDSSGNLNRRKLRKTIVSSPRAKSSLESILHPLIRQRVIETVDRITTPYCILVIPLYAETKGYEWTDRVMVVDVPERTQIKRLAKRDGMGDALAQAQLNIQASREQRLALADDVISNAGSKDELADRINLLHQQYLSLADQQRNR